MRAWLFILLSTMVLTSWAQPFLDYWGEAVPSKDRPLLISSQHMMSPLFEDPAMATDANSMNFISRLAIDPENFDLEGIQNLLGGEEYLAYIRSKLGLENDFSEGGFEFNGRIIIEGHGGEGEFATATRLNEFDGRVSTEEFGERLGQFFKRFNIKPTEIDFVSCCGEINAAKLLKGLEKAGVRGFKLRGFRGKTHLVFNRARGARVEFATADGSSSINAADFYRNGQVPDGVNEHSIQLTSSARAACG